MPKKKIMILIFLSCHLFILLSLSAKGETVGDSLPESDIQVAEGSNKDGHGIIKSITNYTDYPLEISGSETLAPKGTENGNSEFGMNRALNHPLILSGHAFDDPIMDFGPDKAVNLKPMWSKGCAWMTKSMESPGQATLQFIASAGDSGNIQVLFGREISPKVDLRIIIGGAKKNSNPQASQKTNQIAAIVLNDEIIAQTDKESSPYAAAMSGLFIPYWVSVNNGFVMMGSGIQGTNITLSAFIPNLPEIDRIGFSTHDSDVMYSQASQSQALVPIAPQDTYSAAQKDLTLSSKSKPVQLSYPLRVMNEGSIIFSARPTLPITIILSNDIKDRYEIMLQPDKETAVRIQKNGKETFTIHGSSPTSEQYWFSINRGIIMMGLDKLGNDIFLAWEDQTPFENISHISFAAQNQIISNIQFSSPVTIGTCDLEGKLYSSSPYEKPLTRIDYNGALEILRPIGYKLFQDGQRVSLTDTVNGDTYPVIATPQQGAKYYLDLAIGKTGTPTMKLDGMPIPSLEKLKLEAAAEGLDARAGAIKDVAKGLFTASKVVGYAMSNIIIFGIDAIGAAISLVLSGVGAGVWAGGAEVAADAAKKRLEIKEGYRSHDSFVFTEKVERDAAGIAIATPKAGINKVKVRELLEEVSTVASKEDFSSDVVQDENEPHSDPEALKTERLIKLLSDILELTDHPCITEDGSLRDPMIESLKSLTENYQNFPDLHDNYLKLFSSALTNPLLLDDTNDNDAKTRDLLYQAFLNVGESLFKQILLDPVCPLFIPPLQGEYLWIPGQLTIQDEGWITFEVKGQKDLLIGFAKDRSYVRKADNHIYECILGSYNNKCHEFHVQNLGRPAAKYVSTSSNPILGHMLWPRLFTPFWISLKKGRLTLGYGTPALKKDNSIDEDEIKTKKTILKRWSDPFPWKGIQYIGISSWQTPVTIRNLQTSIIQPSDLTQNQGDTDPTQDQASDEQAPVQQASTVE